eukprot:CAMPEP_0183718542 /NCGR_PEP_ID=MMETSP0737-20130205/11773_1 /TAXON_ID=385413 /ORGANISM="Thalassiosira miniscula, Strain CCMP1093" /LENGTH=235 /DNA_ID=CAMNT_0025948119 /DNA_START=102 /DNA_END=806 /DNA_ORIENTATION=+
MKTNKYHNRYLQKILAKLANNDPKTKEVVLDGLSLGDEHQQMARLAMSLISNIHIKTLCLNNCGITTKGAHLLAYALGRNRSLDHLWLNNNRIGSSGAAAIAALLANNRTLLTVCLSNNSIGNHGGKSLANVMRQNHSLTDIYVHGNRMSDKIADEINRIQYDEGYGGVYDYQICNNDSNSPDYYDDGTVAESVVSKTFASRILTSIEEVEYESDSNDSGDDCSTTSPCSDDEHL